LLISETLSPNGAKMTKSFQNLTGNWYWAQYGQTGCSPASDKRKKPLFVVVFARVRQQAVIK
jgi:hypothetical protein